MKASNFPAYMSFERDCMSCDSQPQLMLGPRSGVALSVWEVHSNRDDF